MAGTLRRGAKGRGVAEWQGFLKSQGFDIEADGDFGIKTKIATAMWQKRAGLKTDGVVGRKSWDAKAKAEMVPIPRPRPQLEQPAAPVMPVESAPLGGLEPQFPTMMGAQPQMAQSMPGPGFAQEIDTRMARERLEFDMQQRQRKYLEDALWRKVHADPRNR